MTIGCISGLVWHPVTPVACELLSFRLLPAAILCFAVKHGEKFVRNTEFNFVELRRCNRKESHLKKSLMAWYQLNELQCHLEYVIAHEEHQIDCLDVATDIVHLSEADFTDTVGDLQVSYH
jgi:hypothetical protein